MTNKSKHIETIYGLSPMQEGMLFHALYEPESAMYFERVSCSINGSLDVSLLEKALQTIFVRHAVLRTSFVWKNREKPLQVVLKSVHLPLTIHDWRDKQGQETAFEAFLEEDLKHRFQLNKAPLVRLNLIQLSPQRHLFVWSHHHILLDGWSLARVIGEVFACYEMLRAGSAPQLPVIRPFRDYLRWLDKHASSSEYWRELMQGFETPNQLAQGNGDADEIWLEMDHVFSAELSQAARESARLNQVTVNNLVQAAWALLLSRYSCEKDVVFGAIVSGRPASLEGVDAMVGLFINSLPMRVTIDDHEVAVHLLRRFRDQQAAHDEHAHTPLVEIQGYSGVARGAALFESILVFENYPIAEALSGGELSLAISDVRHHEQTNYPLTLAFFPGETLVLKLSCDPACFKKSAMQGILKHFQNLFAALVKDASRPLYAYTMLTRSELSELDNWGRNPVDNPLSPFAHRQFEHHAARTPEAPALVCDCQAMSYDQLNKAANRLAHHLIERGVGPESMVAICMPRTEKTIIAMLAVLKAGAAYTPLDPTYPAERLDFMLEDTSAAALLTVSGLTDATHYTGAVILMDRLETSQNEQNPDVPLTADNMAYLIYTSGSTGRPKGVMITHAGLANQLLWRHTAFDLNASDRVLQNIPFSFDPSVWQITWPLTTGASLYLIDEQLSRDTGFLADYISENAITATAMVPSQLQVLLDQPSFRKAPLKHISCGGEALTGDLQDRFIAETGLENVLNVVYGPTEASIDASSQTAFSGSDPNIVHIGKPISNTRLYVLDESMRPKPAGIPGELYIGGIGLARGYMNRGARTAQSFIPNPFSKTGERLYASGDLAAWLPDGRLSFLGRKDHQVKVRGFRIELGEIEKRLAQHADVIDGAVVAFQANSGDKQLAAFVTVTDHHAVLEKEILSFLAETHPAHFIPAQFNIIEVFPKLTSGKIDRKTLVRMAGSASTQETIQLIPAQSPSEEILMGIWKDVLGRDQMGTNLDFFELGGHSLLATRVITRARAVFDIDLPVRVLFENPTIHTLAAVYDQASGSKANTTPMLPADRTQPLPLSFAQQRMWFFESFEDAGSVYNMPVQLIIRGPLEINRLFGAMGAMIERHEILRASFPSRQGQPELVIDEGNHIKPDFVDVSLHPHPVTEARRLAIEEIGRPFDVSSGPLLRITLIKIDDQSHALVLNMHHIITDGWSLGVMVRELAATYATDEPLPALPIQYADFAAWQQDHLAGEHLEEQIQWWRRQLQDAPSLLQLPLDHPRPAVQTYHADAETFQIAPELTQAIHELARRNGASLFMTLLSAYASLLSRYSGQDDVLIGSPVAGRNRAEIEPLIGLFINTLVFRCDLTEDPSFKQTLARVRQTALDAYRYQDAPFERIVDAIEPDRNLSHSPIFQAFFALQNNSPEQAEFPGLKLEPFDLGQRKVAPFELSLEIHEAPTHLACRLEYNTDLFQAATIRRMTGHFINLLRAVTENEKQRLSALSLMDQSELIKLRALGRKPAGNYDLSRPVFRLFETNAAQHAQATAVKDTKGESLSYKELDQYANGLATALVQTGVKPEKRIGVFLQRGAHTAAAILGVFKSGGVLVMLDPSFPKQRLEVILQDAAIGTVISDSGHAPMLPDFTGSVIDINQTQPQTEPPSLNADLIDHAAYMIYTSGTTGKPKGVVITHRALAHTLLNNREVFGFGPTHHMLCVSNFHFDISLFELLHPLLAGASSIILSQDDLLEMEKLSDQINQAACIHTVPSLMDQIQRHARENGLSYPAMKRVFTGGDQVPAHVLDAMSEVFPNASVDVLYGPTEATMICAHYSTIASREIGSPIGGPFPGCTLHVVDAQLNPVPIGVPGELLIGGAGVAREYHGLAELTNEKFVLFTFPGEEEATRVYRSGDLVRYRADGNLEFLGRADNQVKIRGFRIELGEIQAALASHPQVENAEVLAIGESNRKRLIAYVTGSDLQKTDLNAFLAQHLPDYMLPFSYVHPRQMPLTPNGKIDRKALAAMEIESNANTSITEPRNPIERKLAHIWADLLGLETVGIHQNFFELGGDSILSIQVVAKAAQAGVHINPRQLFTAKTIARLAEEASESAIISAPQEAITGDLPHTPVQVQFLQTEHANPHHYNQSLFFILSADVQPQQLTAAVNAIGAHHDSLRLRFRQKDQWTQTNKGLDHTPNLEMLDLSQTPEKLEAVAADIQASLNLEQGPIARFVRIDLGAGQVRFLMAVHHLVIDAVSWRILLEDLQAAYEKAVSGQEIKLPPKTTPYRDWARRLHAHAQSQTVADEADFWLDMAAETTPIESRVGERRAATVEFDPETTRNLLTSATTAYNNQVPEILLTALARAWNQNDALWVELESHGRDHPFEDIDLSRTTGWFTAQYPVKLTLTGAQPGENLKTIKEQLRAIPNGGFHYGLLRYLNHQYRDDFQDIPRPTIVFNYLGQTDQTLAQDAILTPASENMGPLHDPQSAPNHLLEINAVVSGGQLRIALDDCGLVEDIQAFGLKLKQELQNLIQHCIQPGVGAYTPSDFDLIELDQNAIDRITSGGKDIEDIYPLTPLQQGMYYHAILDQGSDPYFGYLSCLIEGDLNLSAFRTACLGVTARHSALRTSFIQNTENLELLQRVHTFAEPQWVEEDWRGQDEHLRLATRLQSEQEKGFPLDQAPLMRFVLARTDRGYRFIWCYHHIIMDGWSLPIILKTIFETYEDASAQTQSPPFRNFVGWLTNQPDASSWWREELAGFETPTPLLGDSVHIRSESWRHGELTFTLETEESAALETFARNAHVTLSTLVQGAWALTLGHLSGEENVVYGVTVSGRPADLAGVTDMVGLFINTLPARVRLDAQTPLTSWLKTLQEDQQQREAHGFLSLADIQTQADTGAGAPLFDSLVVFENYPAAESAASAGSQLTVSDFEVMDRNNLPLTLIVAPGTNISLRVGYDARRFDENAVIRLAQAFLARLRSMPDLSEARLGLFDLVTQDEWVQLRTWNRTHYTFPNQTCIHHLFEQQVVRTPHACALVFDHPDGEQQLTYQELNQRANKLAHLLRSKGVTSETSVAVYLNRSLDMVISLYAILKAGAFYVPIDPDYPADRIRFMLEDAQPVLVISHARLSPDMVFLDLEKQQWRNMPLHNPDHFTGPDHAMYMIYTSGSTGRPKGVINTHHALCNRINWMQQAFLLDQHDRILQKTPFSFDVSVWEFFWPLLYGAQLVIAQPGKHGDPVYLTDLIKRQVVTTLHFVPSMLDAFLAHHSASDCVGLKRIICSGEALSRQTQRRCQDLLPAQLHNLYGPTEAAIDVTWRPCSPLDTTTPIGKPIHNTQIHILDRHGRPTPIGVPGLLHIGGVNLARGYHGRPGLTAQRFLPNPFSKTPGMRIYDTGDLAWFRQDGDIEYAGRVDHQVKLRGFRIELGEIEAALEQCEEIRSAVVLVRDDSLRAFVCADPDWNQASVKQQLNAALPAFMVPQSYHRFDAFPVTPNGKADRKALAAIVIDASTTRSVVEPRNPVELELVRIWEDLLSISPISVESDFFELGGHSILAVKLMARIKQVFHRELPLAVLFKANTPERLAALLSESEQNGPVVCLNSKGEGAPLFLVHAVEGDGFVYTHLAGQLERPCYALHAPALYGDAAAPDMATMAEQYIQAIRAIQPKGPYHLGGWSMGGVVALEMARQLLEAGRGVAQLLILDGVLPDDMFDIFDETQLLLGITREMASIHGFAEELPESWLNEFPLEQRFDRLIDWISQRHPDFADQDTRNKLARSWETFKSNFAAARSYKPGPYPGHIHFFCATERVQGEPDLSKRWCELAQNGITIQPVPGSHLTLIHPPHVETLVERLNTSLRLTTVSN